jgi:hypothetical protein
MSYVSGIKRTYSDRQTIKFLENESDIYNSTNRRSFYINDEAMDKFYLEMSALREVENIRKLNDMVKHGYISQHWR